MDWKTLIKKESEKDYFKNLSLFLQEDAKQHTIYPKHKDLFKALKFCPMDKIKVLILGQDPYHGPNQAHGLSFSVPEGQPQPPSLKNIFKELNLDLGVNFLNGCLINWAEQGVLLLNSVLTVRQGQPNSHQGKGWETFTDTVIQQINLLDRPIVHLLWGSYARKKKQLITNSNHLVLETVHPSPLSAYNGFFGCKHFSKTNNFLIQHNLDPIDWSIK